MNSRIVIALFAVMFCLSVAAQRRADKVEALRVAYITKHVSMSEIERERFWPVYNEYHDKLRAVRRDLVRLHRSYTETMGEEEVKALAAREIELRKAEKEIHGVYSSRISAIIGPRKYIRMRVAEEEFRKEMLKIARDE